MKPEFIIPDWPVKSNIRALSTTRKGGVSEPPYNSFNIAGHVEDELKSVNENRRLLKAQGNLPSEPVWLQQIHGITIVDATPELIGGQVQADGIVSSQANIVCLVQTADCLPVLATNTKGDKIGAFHAGWRGLVSGIIENGITAMATEPDEILVWLGPAIGPRHFEVGEEVYQAFAKKYPGRSKVFTEPVNGKRYLDIVGAARLILGACGVSHIYGGDYCTYRDKERFFSFRRDKICGRMASMIWMAN